jgi:FtsH-binding integral membrane protein
MVHRGIATLAGALMVCFLLLSHADPQFFLLHLYQSLIYLAVILMLFYFEDHWAYMIGMLAPAVWLLLTYASGLLGGTARTIFRLLSGRSQLNEISLLAAITALLSVLMIVFCAYRWKREFAGLGKGLGTFLVSLVIVVVYYAILVIWFWRQIPQNSANG